MKNIQKIKQSETASDSNTNATRRLAEGNLDPFAAGGHGATSTDTLHDGVVATATTVAGTAVVELVALLARLGAGVLAPEDASVHVRDALGADHADAAAVHVDVTRNIKGASRAKGNLSPGVVDTTEQGKVARRCDRGACGGNVCGKGQLDSLALLDANRDVGLEGVDGHAGEGVLPPAVVDSVFAVVGDLHTPGAVAADPDTAVVGLVVLADLCADLVGNAGNANHDIGDDVAARVVRVGAAGGGRWGRIRSLGGSGGSGRGLDLGSRGDDGSGGLLLSSWGGGSGLVEDGAPVDLLPVDVLQVVGELAPVEGWVAALGSAGSQYGAARDASQGTYASRRAWKLAWRLWALAAAAWPTARVLSTTAEV